MNEDLNLPIALGVLHERVRTGNSQIAEGDLSGLSKSVSEVVTILAVLSLLDETESAKDNSQVIAALVQALLAERDAARARKDFAAADALRDKLIAAGLTIEDTTNGVRWSIQN